VLSTTSIMHLCAIALYRYVGIAYPLRMRSAQEARHVAALVVPAWTIAITLSVPFVVQGATHSGKLFPAASRSQSGAPDTSRRWSSSGCFFGNGFSPGLYI